MDQDSLLSYDDEDEELNGRVKFEEPGDLDPVIEEARNVLAAAKKDVSQKEDAKSKCVCVLHDIKSDLERLKGILKQLKDRNQEDGCICGIDEIMESLEALERIKRGRSQCLTAEQKARRELRVCMASLAFRKLARTTHLTQATLGAFNTLEEMNVSLKALETYITKTVLTSAKMQSSPFNCQFTQIANMLTVQIKEVVQQRDIIDKLQTYVRTESRKQHPIVERFFKKISKGELLVVDEPRCFIAVAKGAVQHLYQLDETACKVLENLIVALNDFNEVCRRTTAFISYVQKEMKDNNEDSVIIEMVDKCKELQLLVEGVKDLVKTLIQYVQIYLQEKRSYFRENPLSSNFYRGLLFGNQQSKSENNRNSPYDQFYIFWKLLEADYNKEIESTKTDNAPGMIPDFDIFDSPPSLNDTGASQVSDTSAAE